MAAAQKDQVVEYSDTGLKSDVVVRNFEDVTFGIKAGASDSYTIEAKLRVGDVVGYWPIATASGDYINKINTVCHGLRLNITTNVSGSIKFFVTNRVVD